jgi:putative toxin-antitoxin system antitoxin component (TIGR02293 family)
MNIQKGQMAKKSVAKSKVAQRGGVRQKKDISALLQQAEDDDAIETMTETLKGRVVYRVQDVKRAKGFRRRSERSHYIHHVLIERIKEGIKASSFEMVTEAYGIPMSEGYRVMRIPQSTLRRRMKDGKLLPDESDRVYRYAELMTLATEMMNQDASRAATWFKTEMDIFDGETPLQHAMTEVGAREVEDLIGRIRHGVFS